MPGAEGVRVRGLRELNRAFALAGAQTRTELRTGFRRLAEPVRVEAEQLARSEITRITEPWARMRTGVTTKLVYVAPRRRGIKARGDPRKRPNFAGLLMTRALAPALEAKKGQVERGVERLIDNIADDFNRGA